MGAVTKRDTCFSVILVKTFCKENWNQTIPFTHYFESSLIILYFWKENEEGIRMA